MIARKYFYCYSYPRLHRSSLFEVERDNEYQAVATNCHVGGPFGRSLVFCDEDHERS